MPALGLSLIFEPPERAKSYWIRTTLNIIMIRQNRNWLWILLLPLVTWLAPDARAVCTYTLSAASRTHGYGTASNVVSLTTSNACAWTVVNTNSWITLTTQTNGLGSFTNIYLVAANTNPVWRTGIVLIANQQFTIKQNPSPCDYSLSPGTRTHGYAFTTGTVSIATSGGCPSTVTNANNWITIVSNSSGIGDNTVTYTVNNNVSANWRTGSVFIANQTYIVIQRGAPCLYAISPATRVITSAAASGSIAVTATPACGWVSSNANSWITLTSGASGIGNGSVNYSVAANSSGIARTGAVQIADQWFTLSQPGVTCAYSISPTTQTYATGPGGGQVSVTATPGCTWATSNTNGWISVSMPQYGTGSGSVTYSVPGNPGSSRTGVVVIAGRNFAIRQTGLGCTFKLSPVTRVHGNASSTNTVTLTTSNTCPWDVINTNEWLEVTSGNSGTGSNIITYVIASNASPDDRTGVVLIGDQPFTVTQHGVICSYSISPDTRTHGFGAASNYVSVYTSSGCSWSVVNSNAWLTMPAGGTGDAVLGYLVGANPDAMERVGTVMIGDQFLVVTQRAAPCGYSIAATNVTYGFSAETGSVVVAATGGCSWTANNTNSWIALLSATNGTGSGIVNYSLSTNIGAASRTGNLLVAGAVVTVTQLPMSCNYKLSPTNRAHGPGATANIISVTASNGCTWNVINTNAWISITAGQSGNGSAQVNYSVSANSGVLDRMGVLLIGGQAFMLTQRGVGCIVSVSPGSRTHGYGAALNSLTVTTSTNCSWTATTTNDWITVTQHSNGTGNATVYYSVDANPSGLPRSGAIVVGDQALALSQGGAPCTYSLLPAGGSHGAGVETGTVSVTAVSGCSWSVSNSIPWIAMYSDSNSLGNGAVTYTVDANSTFSSRTGVVMIADVLYAVIQSGLPAVCSYRLSPTNRTHGYGSAANTISLVTDGGCQWTVVNTNDWIAINSSLNGISSATVSYTVEPNPNLDDRSGVILVGGQSFILTQKGLSCSYSMSPSARTHGFAAATGIVNVAASSGCSWTVVNTNSWITVVAGASGTGNGSFMYTVPGNFNPIQRTGTVTVADQVLTMVQRAATNGFVFEAIAMESFGQSKLRLAGAPAGVWRLQGSSNLINWVNISNITNITGVVEYTDSGSTNIRFYRAVQP